MIRIVFRYQEKRAIAYDFNTEIGECNFEETEDIWNITALVVSVLSVLLSLYALRQATTKNTSDMYLFFISQYAKEDMKLALRKLKDIKRGVYRLEQWESDMKA